MREGKNKEIAEIKFNTEKVREMDAQITALLQETTDISSELKIGTVLTFAFLEKFFQGIAPQDLTRSDARAAGQIDSITAIADELRSNSRKLKNGDITEPAYIEDCLWLSLEATLKSQQQLDEDLSAEFDDFKSQLAAEEAQFNELIAKAFASDFRDSLRASAALARAAGVKEDDLLQTAGDIDRFFME